MERRREDDVGAKKLEERLKWGVEIVKEIAEKEKFAFDKDVFLKGLTCGTSLFIQSERR